MSLELVADDLDGATHARLDAAVLETADYDPSTLPLASFLLATIVSTSDGRLDSRYGENPKAKSLLQGHLDQMNMLNVAWRDKSLPRRLCRCRGTIGGQSSITTNYTMGGPSK